MFEDDENVDTEDIIKELRRSQDDLDNASSSSNDEDNELGNSAAEEDDIEENGVHPEDESQDQPDESEPPLPPSVLLDMGQSTQPPGTYLVPKHVSYGTMLAQGQLYARSWLELQVSHSQQACGGFGLQYLLLSYDNCHETSQLFPRIFTKLARVGFQ